MNKTLLVIVLLLLVPMVIAETGDECNIGCEIWQILWGNPDSRDGRSWFDRDALVGGAIQNPLFRDWYNLEDGIYVDDDGTVFVIREVEQLSQARMTPLFAEAQAKELAARAAGGSPTVGTGNVEGRERGSNYVVKVVVEDIQGGEVDLDTIRKNVKEVRPYGWDATGILNRRSDVIRPAAEPADGVVDTQPPDGSVGTASQPERSSPSDALGGLGVTSDNLEDNLPKNLRGAGFEISREGYDGYLYHGGNLGWRWQLQRDGSLLAFRRAGDGFGDGDYETTPGGVLKPGGNFLTGEGSEDLTPPVASDAGGLEGEQTPQAEESEFPFSPYYPAQDDFKENPDGILSEADDLRGDAITLLKQGDEEGAEAKYAEAQLKYIEAKEAAEAAGEGTEYIDQIRDRSDGLKEKFREAGEESAEIDFDPYDPEGVEQASPEIPSDECGAWCRFKNGVTNVFSSGEDVPTTENNLEQRIEEVQLEMAEGKTWVDGAAIGAGSKYEYTYRSGHLISRKKGKKKEEAFVVGKKKWATLEGTLTTYDNFNERVSKVDAAMGKSGDKWISGKKINGNKNDEFTIIEGKLVSRKKGKDGTEVVYDASDGEWFEYTLPASEPTPEPGPVAPAPQPEQEGPPESAAMPPPAPTSASTPAAQSTSFKVGGLVINDGDEIVAQDGDLITGKEEVKMRNSGGKVEVWNRNSKKWETGSANDLAVLTGNVYGDGAEKIIIRRNDGTEDTYDRDKLEFFDGSLDVATVFEGKLVSLRGSVLKIEGFEEEPAAAPEQEGPPISAATPQPKLTPKQREALKAEGLIDEDIVSLEQDGIFTITVHTAGGAINEVYHLDNGVLSRSRGGGVAEPLTLSDAPDARSTVSSTGYERLVGSKNTKYIEVAPGVWTTEARKNFIDEEGYRVTSDGKHYLDASGNKLDRTAANKAKARKSSRYDDWQQVRKGFAVNPAFERKSGEILFTGTVNGEAKVDEPMTVGNIFPYDGKQYQVLEGGYFKDTETGFIWDPNTGNRVFAEGDAGAAPGESTVAKANLNPADPYAKKTATEEPPPRPVIVVTTSSSAVIRASTEPRGILPSGAIPDTVPFRDPLSGEIKVARKVDLTAEEAEKYAYAYGSAGARGRADGWIDYYDADGNPRGWSVDGGKTINLYDGTQQVTAAVGKGIRNLMNVDRIADKMQEGDLWVTINGVDYSLDNGRILTRATKGGKMFVYADDGTRIEFKVGGQGANQKVAQRGFENLPEYDPDNSELSEYSELKNDAQFWLDEWGELAEAYDQASADEREKLLTHVTAAKARYESRLHQLKKKLREIEKASGERAAAPGRPAPKPGTGIPTSTKVERPDLAGKNELQAIEALATWVADAQEKVAMQEGVVNTIREQLDDKNLDESEKTLLRETLIGEEKELQQKKQQLTEIQEEAEEEAEKIEEQWMDDKAKAELGKRAFDEKEEAEQTWQDEKARYERLKEEFDKTKRVIENSKAKVSSLSGKSSDGEIRSLAKNLDVETEVNELLAKGKKKEAIKKLKSSLTQKEAEVSALEDAVKDKKNILDEAELELKKKEAKLNIVSKGVGTKWEGSAGLLAYKWVTESPRFPALTNAIFGDAEWYKDYKTSVDRTFAKAYLGGYIEAAICDAKYDLPPGEDAAYVQTGTGLYQFVGSIQAERSASKSFPLVCDENERCPGTLTCKDNLCYSGNKVEMGYLYKITWGVTAPTDTKFTTRDDEARDEVDFNLRIDGHWLFVNPQTGYASANTNHLPLGASSHSLGLPLVIIEYHPDEFQKACIIFGENRPKNYRGEEVSDLCAHFKPTSMGTIDADNQPRSTSSSSGSSTKPQAGSYCGLNC